VRDVFSSVASKYDLMNDAMSLGVHRLWKDYFVRRLDPPADTKLLDVAGGTGDVAFRFLADVDRKQRRANKRRKDQAEGLPSVAPAEVTVCDINPSMLEAGK